MLLHNDSYGQGIASHLIAPNKLALAHPYIEMLALITANEDDLMLRC